MLTIDDIKYVSFRKAGIGGYKTDDVDIFIDGVLESFRSLQDKNNAMSKQLDELTKQLEHYKHDEECIRNALVSAQRLSDSSITEAKQKADEILKEASEKAEQALADAQKQVDAKHEDLNRLKKDVADFRENLLNIYKEHLKVIDALPTQEPEKAKRYTSKATRRTKTEKEVIDIHKGQKGRAADDIPFIGPISIDIEALKREDAKFEQGE